MTKRILRIGIASKGAIHKRLLDIARGDRKLRPDEPKVWFTSMEAMARVFSKQNILLMEIIRDCSPESVTELADRVGRNKANVLRSLKALKQYEVVDFEEGKGGRRAPRLKYDDVSFDFRLLDRAA